jgi:hypothetical protein
MNTIAKISGTLTYTGKNFFISKALNIVRAVAFLFGERDVPHFTNLIFTVSIHPCV